MYETVEATSFDVLFFTLALFHLPLFNTLLHGHLYKLIYVSVAPHLSFTSLSWGISLVPPSLSLKAKDVHQLWFVYCFFTKHPKCAGIVLNFHTADHMVLFQEVYRLFKVNIDPLAFFAFWKLTAILKQSCETISPKVQIKPTKFPIPGSFTILLIVILYRLFW